MKWLIFICGPIFVVAVPKFDESAIMRNILVPADAAVNSAIYRLKAYDTSFDYPLIFKLGEISTTVSLETLNCTKFNSICQANVILKNRLEIGRLYDFSVSVSNSKGDSDVMQCSFRATNATTPIERIFPGAPALLTVSESARRNHELGSIIARGKTTGDRKVLLELYGPPQFGLRQRTINGRDVEGTIWLLSSVDYEKNPSHHLVIFANDPWTDTNTDTRNIASWPIFVSVLDEQDTPPVFTQVPPTTALDPNLKVEDVILTIHAEDGDKGTPRDIRYALVENDNPLSQFFEVLEATGELRLAKPLPELIASAPPKTPILLTIRADEVRYGDNEPPAQSSSVQLALIPPPLPGTSPKFGSDEYTATIDENAPSGTKLEIKNAEIVAQKGAVLTLELLNNNGTFDITPNIINGKSNFTVTVRDNSLLDYESRHSVQCDILAKEIGEKTTNFTTRTRLVVYLNDVNDNTPTFRKIEWKAELPEHANFGTSVAKVEATGTEDSEVGNVKYTRIFGPGSDSFQIDPNTGLITVSKPDKLDTVNGNAIKFYVEATDDKVADNTATATVLISLVDINDKAPKFEKNPYEFILDESKEKFTIPAFIKAVDNDTTSPNNEVHYELIESVENITLDSNTGELKINNSWTKSGVITLHARAYDGGIPRLSDQTEIRLYPPENKFRKMVFVVPGRNPNKEEIARTLSAIVGDTVTIDEVRPYRNGDGMTTDIRNTQNRSVVVVTVPNSANAVVDVNEIQKMLDQKTVEKETIIRKAEGPNLWWLFWLLLLLVLLIAIIVILCCMCECCPWYVPPRKKKKVQSAEVTRLVVNGSGQGKESKSVQVAEWFGRREAWTPEAAAVDNERDSLRRYELERGSERGGARKAQRQNHTTQDALPRDQFYIREGNADILRLITRGNEQQRPITLVQEQPYIIDSGKDILLRRFIDQQQTEVHRPSVMLPNAVKLQAENEMLEASLRHQNALLRQILNEREREMRLETQSLPAGTQTDHDACTQTEPLFLRPPKRKTRSDNDASDYSDDEEEKYRRRFRRTGRISIKRKINTPIQEESETNLDVEKQQKSEAQLSFGHTRTSLLRKKAAEKRKSKSALRREVLREISASLLHSDGSDSDVHYKRGSFSDDSLEDRHISRKISLKKYSDSSKSDSQKNKRYHSTSDLRSSSLEKRAEKKVKSQSQADLTQKPRKTGKKKSSSRYMEWYKKDDVSKRKKSEDTTILSSATSRTSTNVTKKLMGESQAQGNKDKAKALGNGPEHPLIQHSEHRFEAIFPRRLEDDGDSGIALTRPAMAQKKSVFTIAYDDMQTRQIRQNSATPPF